MANLIGFMNLAEMPLPRLWYLPSTETPMFGQPIQKAAIVMTADDHVSDFSGSGTLLRFDVYANADPSGGKAIRSTSYIDCNHGEGRYEGTYEPPLERQTCNQPGKAGLEQPSDEAFAVWAAQGFEVGLHPTLLDDAVDFDEYAEFYDHQLGLWKDKYVSLPTPSTNRTDGIWWYNYDEQGVVEFDRRIRLDTNYMYWWDHQFLAYYDPLFNVGLFPGLFNGSGLPMRFTSETGELIDVYQAATQITDQSQQCVYYEGDNPDPDACEWYGKTVPNTVEKLLLAAYDNGYYGIFTVLSHTDRNIPCESDRYDSFCMSEKILARAREHRTPVYAAREMLDWVDGRNGSSFRELGWDDDTHTLQFEIETGVGTDYMLAMVPSQAAGGLPLSQFDGAPILTCETIKGVEYAFFWAAPGTYTATYGGLTPICSPGAAPSSSGAFSTQLPDPQPVLAWLATEGLDTENNWSVAFAPSMGGVPLEDSESPTPWFQTSVASPAAANTEEGPIHPSVGGVEAPAALLDSLFTDLGMTLLLEETAEEVTSSLV